MWVGLISFYGHHRGDTWIIPSFRIWGYVLHAEHISCVIMNCGQHPFSTFNGSVGLTGGKYYQKIIIPIIRLFTPQPSRLEEYCRHGPGSRAGACQISGTHISVFTWWIFFIRSSVELSRPVVAHCHGHLPICSIWVCPWAKKLSNLPQIGFRLCGTHISETAAWI